jgi:hypothetical protein
MLVQVSSFVGANYELIFRFVGARMVAAVKHPGWGLSYLSPKVSYKLRFSPPIVSQIDRALWSSSIILSTSTVRKTSWERSIDERRGRGRGGSGKVLMLALYRINAYVTITVCAHSSISSQLPVNRFCQQVYGSNSSPRSESEPSQTLRS